MYGDQCTEGSLDDDTLVFHLDVDSHATSGHWQVCALWILSTSQFNGDVRSPRFSITIIIIITETTVKLQQ